MNSNDLRQKITKAIKDDERTGSFSKAFVAWLDRSGIEMSLVQQVVLVGFLKKYIACAPDVLDEVYVAARNAHVLAGLQPIFDAAFQYWEAHDDLIPDQTGLIGLADDAYLSLHLMEAASNFHQQQTGQPLLSKDFKEINDAMRKVIGEPVISQLDGIVSQTMAVHAVQIGLEQLAGFRAIFPVNFANYFAGANHSDLAYEANVRLGAMGGPLPY